MSAAAMRRGLDQINAAMAGGLDVGPGTDLARPALPARGAAAAAGVRGVKAAVEGAIKGAQPKPDAKVHELLGQVVEASQATRKALERGGFVGVWGGRSV